MTGNVVNAQLTWFVDAQNHDLHLAATAPVIDTVQNIPEVIDDFDGDHRPVGNAPDVGADEFRTPAPPPTFQDVSAEHWAYVYIEALYQAGYIAGCSADPPYILPRYSDDTGGECCLC